MDQSDLQKEVESLVKHNKMKTQLPLLVFFLLVIAILSIPLYVIPYWYHMTEVIESKLDSVTHNAHHQLMSEFENIAKLLAPMNSSAVNVARILTSNLQGNEFSFPLIEAQVAPALFQALSTMPFLSQASYIGLDGLFFAYYKDGAQTFVVYSNTTFPTNSSFGELSNPCYIQPVYSESGKLYRNITISKPFIATNASWFQKSLNSTNGYASLGMQWNSENEHLFLNTASVGGLEGVISLGVPVKVLTDFLLQADLHGAALYLATYDGEVLLQSMTNTSIKYAGDNNTASVRVDLEGNLTVHAGDVPCKPNNGTLNGTTVLNIGGTEFKFYCSPINVVGLQSVYILAFPNKDLENSVQAISNRALGLLIVMLVAIFITLSAFVCIVAIAKWREFQICSLLIKQMDATQQAERKSMNKSLTYANATHDVRAALGGIISLIEVDYREVSPGSELDKNLKLAVRCAKDLLELMNSVLDMSKIEAGKMQLTEEEFSLPELLEDVADLFHPLGMKKGVEVVLDFCDGSVSRNPVVKGDRGKLKQILSNLLSNAVKFTSDGHVSVRAWTQKPSMENSIIASNQNISSFMNGISCLFSKKEVVEDLNEMQKTKQDPRCMEFIMEVDDTGKGIPKEKRKSVFENFVQVKETAAGTGGTGLGLGIVQSLVRLMGGEIEILDKEHGETGTCFRFNVFFIVCKDDISRPTNACKQVNVESEDNYPISSDLYPSSGCSISTRADSSLVVVLIHNNERRRMVQEYMYNLGVRAVILKKGSEFCHALRKMKNRLINHSELSSSGLSDLSTCSWMSSGGSSLGVVANKNLHLSTIDYVDNDILPAVHGRKLCLKGPISCILIVIDTSAGDFANFCKSVANFRKDLCGSTSICCKVVWLENPETKNLHFRGLGQENLAPADHVMTKPLHGSRLFQMIELLPQFGAKRAGRISTRWNKDDTKETRIAADLPSQLNSGDTRARSRDSPATTRSRWHSAIEERSSTSSDVALKRRSSTATRNRFLAGEAPEVGSSSSENYSSTRKLELVEPNRGSWESQKVTTIKPGEEQKHDISSSAKPLEGKRILIVDDNQVLGMVSKAFVSRLGASVLLSHSGEEAVMLVSKGLQEKTGLGDPKLPYDYILMDCEMPIMDGFEATKQIRLAERKYGVHIPIIALTAHTADEQGRRIKEAGMDFHMTKPLQQKKLVDYIREIPRQ